MNRDEQLGRLREQLRLSKALYDGAKLDYERTVGLMRDLGKTHPDGSILQATRAITQALQDYSVALDQFNRFLLGPISPSPQPSTECSVMKTHLKRKAPDRLTLCGI